jgi:hypothetical protein
MLYKVQLLREAMVQWGVQDHGTVHDEMQHDGELGSLEKCRNALEIFRPIVSSL